MALGLMASSIHFAQAFLYETEELQAHNVLHILWRSVPLAHPIVYTHLSPSDRQEQ